MLNTEILNNIKNLEIKEGEEFIYKDKILKFKFESKYKIENFIEQRDNYPGMKNIEQLIIIVANINKDKIKIEKNNRIENLIKCVCKQKNNLQKLVINYLCCDISIIIEILCDYCMSYNTLKNIELIGIIEPNDIDKALDNIIKIKNQNVDIIIKILDNDIKEVISNNEKMKNELSFEATKMQIPKTYGKDEFVDLIQIK